MFPIVSADGGKAVFCFPLSSTPPPSLLGYGYHTFVRVSAVNVQLTKRFNKILSQKYDDINIFYLCK